MAKTSVACPNCRQFITVDLTRLFDTNTNPDAKQMLLSGQANYFQCPICKAQGIYPSPVVYHDYEKELLLTYYPPELGAPLDEQERIIGPLIKKVMDDLPQEKRKGYLFKPQSMLTQQRLFETILEADGITPEMLKAQQEKLALIQTMARTKPENLAEVIDQNDAKIDGELLVLLSRLAQASAAGGDAEGAQLLANLQKALLEHSTYGRKAAIEAKETRDAIQALQDLSKNGITRENLLDLIIQSADSEVKVTALASMARNGIDYEFFQLLTHKIENTHAEEKQKLETLREQLLTITAEVDAALKAQAQEAKQLLDELIAAENIEDATQKALPRINAAFGELLNAEAQAAKAAADDTKLEKLLKIIQVVQAASATGAYMELIEALLGAKDAEARKAIFEQAGEAISSEFLQMLGSLAQQVEQSQQDPELLSKLQEINREALRYSMQQNLRREETPA